MASKHNRAGGKFSGTHTSVIPAAATLADAASVLPTVTKIAPGFIKAGLRPTRGKRRIKLTVQDAAVFAAVRDNTSHQELAIFTQTPQETATELVHALADKDMQVVVAD
jgi:hypothetical protein